MLLNGMIWVRRTGAHWKDLPERYGDYRTCHRRFQQWLRSGVLERVRKALLDDLAAKGKLNLEEGFMDATFVAAKKGGLCVGPTKRGKGTKVMAIVDADGTPIAFTVNSASPAENTLVQEVLEITPEDHRPTRLIADKAYDDDRLDQRLEQDFGIELIAPNRRKRCKTQDGRSLRRYRRRWKVERLFAWLSNFRRLNIRWEYQFDNFMGFVTLAFTVILLRRL